LKERGVEMECKPAKNKNILKSKLELEKVYLNAKKLTGRDGVIQLDPNNPKHIEWYEVDKYKGE